MKLITIISTLIILSMNSSSANYGVGAGFLFNNCKLQGMNYNGKDINMESGQTSVKCIKLGSDGSSQRCSFYNGDFLKNKNAKSFDTRMFTRKKLEKFIFFLDDNGATKIYLYPNGKALTSSGIGIKLLASGVLVKRFVLVLEWKSNNLTGLRHIKRVTYQRINYETSHTGNHI